MGAEATLKLLLLGEDRSASKALKGAGKEAEVAKGKFGGMASTAGKVLAGGLLVAGAAAAEFAKSSIDAYRDTAKESLTLARVTGLTITEASRLRFAAEESGVGFDTLSKSARIFDKNLVAAQKTSKTAAAMVKQLGFNFRDARGHLLPMNELLPKVADRFKKMPDGPTKTAIAMKLFGKSGADMIKLLNKGSEGLREFGKESDRTGNTIANTDSYKKNLAAQREFHAALTGLQVQLGSALYPILTTVATYLAEHVGPIISSVTGFVKEHAAAISKIAPIVGILVAALVTLLGGLKLIKTAMLAVNLVMDANPISLVIIAVAALAAGLIYAYNHSKTFRDIVNGAFSAISTAASFMWNNVLKPTFKFLVDAWMTVAGSIIHGAAWAFGWVPGIGGKLKGAAAAFDNFRDQVNGALNGIHDRTITVHLNPKFSKVGAVDVNKALMGAFGIPTTPQKPGRPGPAGGIGPVGMNAMGTSNWRGGLTWVGERGPEILDLPAGSRITPSRPGGGSEDLGSLTVIVKSDTGAVLEQKLVKLKRESGRKKLGFES